MPSKTNENELYLGFLSVTGSENQGLVGGLLILNEVGRPVEFHCTAPVRPNRAQEILYGSALPGFLYGEQISQTLIKHIKSSVVAVLTDQIQVLLAQKDIDYPVIYINKKEKSSEETAVLSDNSHSLKSIELGKAKGLIQDSKDKNFMEANLFFEKNFGAIDPIEPFERIRNAIDEAQRSL